MSLLSRVTSECPTKSFFFFPLRSASYLFYFYLFVLPVLPLTFSSFLPRTPTAQPLQASCSPPAALWLSPVVPFLLPAASFSSTCLPVYRAHGRRKAGVGQVSPPSSPTSHPPQAPFPLDTEATLRPDQQGCRMLLCSIELQGPQMTLVVEGGV